jgi:folylpolyglutamate synthase/dihydropteroate synthase
MLKDKAMIETVAPLIPYVNTWYVCSLLSEATERGSNGVEIADFLKTQGIKSCYTFASVSDAMYSLSQAHCQQECDRALIFGSFYTVAAGKAWLANKEKQGEYQWKKEPNSV